MATIATHSAAVIRCRGLTKEFGRGETRVQALRGIDLELYSGMLTLLVGPSGCGKTTLLSVIAGILDPTGGALSVLGQDMVRMSRRKMVQFRGRNIGFVFQQFNLLGSLTAEENVSVPLVILGENRRRALKKAAETLREVGLGNKLKAFPNQLSGGQQQRVAIARALVHEPRLLVCDEPTSALDHKTGHTIMELLKGVALNQERAVVVVTHDSRVIEFGDRIAFMDDGRVERVEERGLEQRVGG